MQTLYDEDLGRKPFEDFIASRGADEPALAECATQTEADADGGEAIERGAELVDDDGARWTHEREGECEAEALAVGEMPRRDVGQRGVGEADAGHVGHGAPRAGGPERTGDGVDGGWRFRSRGRGGSRRALAEGAEDE